jgi:molecular chaperone GrpE
MVVRRFILIKEDKETVEAPEEEGFLVDDKKEITDEDLENITEEPLSLDKQIEDLQEKVLRAQAEVQNVRRIAAQEVTRARLYGAESLAREFLSVGDNLQRALDSSEDATDLNSMKEGLELTFKSFESALKSAGITSIDPAGENFDPEKHEALSLVQDESREENTVIEVVQKGFMILDRVLRPAKVIVSKKIDKNLN